MPGLGEFVHHHVREGDEQFDNWWSKHEFDLAPRAACQPCNGGWMNDIDRAAEQFVEPCVLGRAQTFRMFGQHRAIASWATLVSFLFDQTQALKVVRSDDFHAFFADPKPPAGSTIWLAATNDQTFEVNGWPRPLLIGSPEHPNAYLCTFRINHLVVQAFIPTDRATEDLTFDRIRSATFVRQIWPSPVTAVSWPPDRIFARADLDNFVTAFDSQPRS